MFQYAETDQAHIVRCIRHHIFYDFHRDWLILFDSQGDLHQGHLDELLSDQSLMKNLSPDARSALHEEKRRNSIYEDDS